MKKIDVYINGKYKFTTNKYKTLKEAKQKLSTLAFIFVAGSGLVGLYGEKLQFSYN